MSEPRVSRGDDDRHLPMPDQDSEGFWAAAQEHRLVVRHCQSCSRSHFYPRRRCPYCLSDDTSWLDHPGTGTIVSYTVVRQAGTRAFKDRVPYILAVIDLGDGVHMMSNVDADPMTVSIGQPVRVAWRTDGDMELPIFEPVDKPL